MKEIRKILNIREENRNDCRKELQEKKMIEKLKKANNQSIYTTKLLNQCKSWNGPVTSPKKLKEVLRVHNQNAERIVRTELSY